MTWKGYREFSCTEYSRLWERSFIDINLLPALVRQLGIISWTPCSSYWESTGDNFGQFFQILVSAVILDGVPFSVNQQCTVFTEHVLYNSPDCWNTRSLVYAKRRPGVDTSSSCPDQKRDPLLRIFYSRISLVPCFSGKKDILALGMGQVCRYYHDFLCCTGWIPAKSYGNEDRFVYRLADRFGWSNGCIRNYLFWKFREREKDSIRSAFWGIASTLFDNSFLWRTNF